LQLFFRLMGIEIVEDDMDGGGRISGGDLIHGVEKLDTPAAALVGGRRRRDRFNRCQRPVGPDRGAGSTALSTLAGSTRDRVRPLAEQSDWTKKAGRYRQDRTRRRVMDTKVT
jgi:hypothetical protein